MTSSNIPSFDATHRTEQFLQLLSAHEDRTRAFIFSLLPNWADAEGIAQDVRLKLWEQFDKYDTSKDFGAWARTIAYYHVLAFRKRSRHRHAQLSDALLERIADTFNADAERLAVRTRLLRKCIEKLSEASRRLLLHCYVGRESIRQVAERLGRSFDAVRKAVFRTRQELAKCIEQEIKREEKP